MAKKLIYKEHDMNKTNKNTLIEIVTSDSLEFPIHSTRPEDWQLETGKKQNLLERILLTI